MPLGPVTLALLVGAVVTAFLRAKNAQHARRHRTADPPDDEADRGYRLSAGGPYYTEEGKRLLGRARLFGRLFYVFALGALLATWYRL